jgi:HEAT repeat protein
MMATAALVAILAVSLLLFDGPPESPDSPPDDTQSRLAGNSLDSFLKDEQAPDRAQLQELLSSYCVKEARCLNLLTIWWYTVSRDANLIAYEDSDSRSQLHVAQLEELTPRHLFRIGMNAYLPHFTSSGKEIVGLDNEFCWQGSRGSICIVDTETGVVKKLKPPFPESFSEYEMLPSPDEKHLAIIAAPETTYCLYLQKLPSEKRRKIATDVFAADWIPDSRHLVVLCREDTVGHLYSVDMKGRKKLIAPSVFDWEKEYDDIHGGSFFVKVDPSGRYAAFTGLGEKLTYGWREVGEKEVVEGDKKVVKRVFEFADGDETETILINKDETVSDYCKRMQENVPQRIAEEFEYLLEMFNEEPECEYFVQLQLVNLETGTTKGINQKYIRMGRNQFCWHPGGRILAYVNPEVNEIILQAGDVSVTLARFKNADGDKKVYLYGPIYWPREDLMFVTMNDWIYALELGHATDPQGEIFVAPPEKPRASGRQREKKPESLSWDGDLTKLPHPGNNKWKNAPRETKIDVIIKLSRLAKKEAEYDGYQRERGEIFAFLAEALEDPDIRVRIAALEAVMELRWQSVYFGVEELKDDEDPLIRSLAAEASAILDEELSERSRLARRPHEIANDPTLGSKEKINVLAKLLQSNRPKVRERIAYALAAVGTQEAARLLENMSKNDPSTSVRIVGATKLLDIRMKDRETRAAAIVEVLRTEYQTPHERESLRSHCLSTVAFLGVSDKEVRTEIQALINATKDDESERKRYQRLLQWGNMISEFGEVEAARRGFEMEYDGIYGYPYKDIQGWAVAALDRCKSPDMVPYLVEQCRKSRDKSTHGMVKNFYYEKFQRMLSDVLTDEYHRALKNNNKAQCIAILEKLRSAGAEARAAELESLQAPPPGK